MTIEADDHRQAIDLAREPGWIAGDARELPPAPHARDASVPTGHHRTPSVRHVHHQAPQRSVSGAAVACLAIGCVAILLCWIPFVSTLSLIVGVVGLLLGVIAMFTIGKRRSGSGMMIGGLVLNSIALFVAFFTSGAALLALSGLGASPNAKQSALQTQSRQTPHTSDSTSSRGAATTQLTSWNDWRQPLDAGDIRIRIRSVAIEPLTIVSDTRRTGESAMRDTAESFLVIQFSVENRSGTHILSYLTWAPNRYDSLIGGAKASLSDEHGNIYALQKMPDGVIVLGASGSQRIRPGESVNDLLAFEVPVDAAQVLYLQMGGENVGSNSGLSFEIRDSTWRKSSSPNVLQPEAPIPLPTTGVQELNEKPVRVSKPTPAWKEPTSVGLATIRILDARVGMVTLADGDRLVSSKTPCLSFRIRVTNETEAPFVYRSYSSVLDGADAFVGDVELARADYQLRVYGRSERSVLKPGASLEDLITFEVPDVSLGSSLQLTLISSVIAGEARSAPRSFEIDLAELVWDTDSPTDP
ncbi:MAG: hypothetical protein KDA16_02775 [Phycisphaerales bacterium]|nr:hypothetical protein [Phycisphaerales bacterium]